MCASNSAHQRLWNSQESPDAVPLVSELQQVDQGFNAQNLQVTTFPWDLAQAVEPLGALVLLF